jgi:hypothetical protein
MGRYDCGLRRIAHSRHVLLCYFQDFICPSEGGISNKFVKNASDYCNSDEEFDIIAAMEGLVA